MADIMKVLTDNEIVEAKHKVFRFESRLSPAAFDMFGRDQCIARAQRDLTNQQWIEWVEERSFTEYGTSPGGDYWCFSKKDWQALKSAIKEKE